MKKQQQKALSSEPQFEDGPRASRFAAGLLFLAGGILLLAAFNGCNPGAGDPNAADKATFHYQLAKNYFYDHNIVMATREAHAVLAIDPDHAEANHLLGFIHFGRKQYTEAITHFRKAIAAKDKYYQAIGNLGAVFLAQKRWEEAAVQFEILTGEQLYPSPSLAHVNLAWALQGLKRYPEALDHYRMALFLNPKLCLGHNNLGLLYESMGEETLALESFERAGKLCPKYAEPFFHLGRMLSAVGQAGRASEAFTRCQQLEPDSMLGRRCATRKL